MGDIWRNMGKHEKTGHNFDSSVVDNTRTNVEKSIKILHF